MNAGNEARPPVGFAELPQLLNATQLMAALGLTRTKFYALVKARTFTRLESPLPGRRLYSKPLVEQWLAGTLPVDPESAKAEGRRFLTMARRKPFARRPSPAKPLSV